MAPAPSTQAQAPAFASAFPLKPGRAESLLPGIARILAPNPGPMTFTGTVTYLVGEKAPAIIDPGPDSDAHLQAILKALSGRPLSAILTTHSHRDHDGLTAKLAAATGAPVLPRREGRIWAEGEMRLCAIATPGHAADHHCLELEGAGVLFSGDHVMTWATSMVEDMAAYMESLARVIALKPALLLPGHGREKRRPGAYLRALLTHRRLREAAVLAQFRAGAESPEAITAAIYPNLDARLIPGATATTRAHLAHLARQGKIALKTPIPNAKEQSE